MYLRIYNITMYMGRLSSHTYTYVPTRNNHTGFSEPQAHFKPFELIERLEEPMLLPDSSVFDGLLLLGIIARLG